MILINKNGFFPVLDHTKKLKTKKSSLSQQVEECIDLARKIQPVDNFATESCGMQIEVVKI